MSCIRFRQLIHADLDGELDAQERETLEAHLEECSACSALALALKSTTSTLEAIAFEMEPEGFQDAIMARVRGKRHGRSAKAEVALPFIGVGIGSAIVYGFVLVLGALATPTILRWVGIAVPWIADAIGVIGSAIQGQLDPAIGSAYVYIPPAVAILAINVALVCVAAWFLRARMAPGNARVPRDSGHPEA